MAASPVLSASCRLWTSCDDDPVGSREGFEPGLSEFLELECDGVGKRWVCVYWGVDEDMFPDGPRGQCKKSRAVVKDEGREGGLKGKPATLYIALLMLKFLHVEDFDVIRTRVDYRGKDPRRLSDTILSLQCVQLNSVHTTTFRPVGLYTDSIEKVCIRRNKKKRLDALY